MSTDHYQADQKNKRQHHLVLTRKRKCHSEGRQMLVHNVSSMQTGGHKLKVQHVFLVI